MTPERRLAFGTVAELYDRSRPSYPAALIDDVLAFAGRPARALESGAGTGRATVLFAARGVAVRAIEPSAEMAALARRNVAAYPEIEVEETDFERFDARGETFGLLYAAQSWHWVAPEVRYVKAADLLAPAGTLALFWNRQRWEDSPLRAELREAYAREAPHFGAEPGPMHPASAAAPELWGDWEPELLAEPRFGEPQLRAYDFSQDYSTEQYLGLLQTHSDHIVLGAPRLERLMAAVGEVIDAAGGTIPVAYTTVLFLARRR